MQKKVVGTDKKRATIFFFKSSTFLKIDGEMIIWLKPDFRRAVTKIINEKLLMQVCTKSYKMNHQKLFTIYKSLKFCSKYSLILNLILPSILMSSLF